MLYYKYKLIFSQRTYKNSVLEVINLFKVWKTFLKTKLLANTNPLDKSKRKHRLFSATKIGDMKYAEAVACNVIGWRGVAEDYCWSM